MEAFSAGTLAGAGSFRCDSCGFAVALHERDEVPACPECGGRTFRRASLFIRSPAPDAPQVEGPPSWLEEAREALVDSGDYVALQDGDEIAIGRYRLYFLNLAGEHQRGRATSAVG